MYTWSPLGVAPPPPRFRQALLIRWCHEDVMLTRKSHYCAGSALFRGTLQELKVDLTDFNKMHLLLQSDDHERNY